MEYAVVVERGPTSFGAYVPDLPGCIAAGETYEEALELIQEAIALHMDDYRERGLAAPAPTSRVAVVEIAA